MKSYFDKYKNIHMIGIKGVGMTMLAQFLKKKGVKISGSDTEEVFLTDKVLKKEKIKVSHFSEKNISKDLGLVINSSAYNIVNNIEIKALSKYPKIKTLSYAEALGDIFSHHYGVAVCGSHGKTTTSAWLGYVLWKGKINPNVLVGSSVPQFSGSSSLAGSSQIFVAESDEYQNKLQYFQAQGVVLNNIDYDHPDFFKTKKDYYQVFADFISRIPSDGFFVANHSDLQIRKLYKNSKAWILNYNLVDNELSYKKNKEKVVFLAYDHYLKDGYQFFKLNDWGEFKIKMLGRHNVYNALAVIAASYALGLEINIIKKHLANFLGTTRRAQLLGEYKGAPIYDDYAHHPTEIKATLSAFKEAYPKKKLIVVFHPHTFTRTKVLFNDFKQSFKEADKLIILDIYGSAREKQGGASSQELITAIKEWNLSQGIKQSLVHQKNLSLASNYLAKNIKDKDLVLLLGAGDVFRIGESLLNL